MAFSCLEREVLLERVERVLADLELERDLLDVDLCAVLAVGIIFSSENVKRICMFINRASLWVNQEVHNG